MLACVMIKYVDCALRVKKFGKKKATIRLYLLLPFWVSGKLCACSRKRVPKMTALSCMLVVVLFSCCSCP